MRIRYFFVLAVFATQLDAQSEYSPTSSGWEVSATFSPALQRRANLNSVGIEITSTDVSISGQTGVETITIGGQERNFATLPATSGIGINTTDNNFWFGGYLRAHRRLKSGFDLFLGLYYSQASYTGRDDGPVIRGSGAEEPDAEVIYGVNRVEGQSLGALAGFNYHISRHKKLHPYLGMELQLINYRADNQFLGRVYTGEPTNLILPTGAIASASTNVISAGVNWQAGLMYRLSPRWSLSLELNTRHQIGTGRTGLQLRYRL